MYLVKNPEDRLSHDTAHFIYDNYLLISKYLSTKKVASAILEASKQESYLSEVDDTSGNS